MDEPNWKLIDTAIADIWRWIREAPTQEVKHYRMGLLREAMNGTLKPQLNEEWDTLEELRQYDGRLPDE